MYRNTRFGELLKGFSRGIFDQMVSDSGHQKHSKGFSSWNQLVVMIFAQLSGCRSLRELEVGFNNQMQSHYHLGCAEVKRSTLSDANSKRDAGVFIDFCKILMHQVNRKLKSEVSDFLYLLDSSSITLKGESFDDWTLENRTRNTQGIKLHLMLNSKTLSPEYFNITPANVNDVTDATNLTIEPSETYVFDKGYCDYNWWHKINEKGAVFVTRFKKNASLIAIEEREIDSEDSDIILSDQIVKFKNKHPRGGSINLYESTLRRITVKRDGDDNPLIIATNDFERSAREIAECYKARWGIELFFKWIKQNLKIKKYLGRTENAVLTQIATALISYLLIAIYRSKKKLNQSLKDVLVLVQNTLFQRTEIDDYLARKAKSRREDINLKKQMVLV